LKPSDSRQINSQANFFIAPQPSRLQIEFVREKFPLRPFN
jgi:hypothetical protein